MMHVFDTKCEALKKTIIFNLDIKTIFLSMIINFTHFIKIPQLNFLCHILMSVSHDRKLEISHQMWVQAYLLK